MRKWWWVAVTFAASCLSPWAQAQVNSLPSQPHLLVKGEAEREVVPDRFSLSIALEATDLDPQAARKRVQADAQTVLALFKASHALADSVEASTLSVQPSTRYVDNREVFEGSKVSRSLAATFASLEDVRAVLGGLHTSEHLQVSGIRTAYSDETRVRGELKRQAVQRTRETARQLADAYGVKLGGLYTISEVAPSFAYGIQAGSWGNEGARKRSALPPPPPPLADIAEPRPADAVSPESLEAGKLTLSENVYAVFLIAQ